LGRRGLTVFVVCQDPNGLAVHSRYCAGAWSVADGPSSPGFLRDISELAVQLDIGSIMVLSEPCHRELIQHRHLFEPSIHLFSPPLGAFAKATDKDFMAGLASQLGIPVARGTTLDRLMAQPSAMDLRFPLVLRTRNQNVSGQVAPWKAAYAEDAVQLTELYRSVREMAANVLVQEYHTGVEDHVQVLMLRGEPFMVGEYFGEHHMPLAGGVTVRRVTCRHEEIVRDAVNLLRAIDWQGVAGVQFHYDRVTGRYIFLEINPRFIGGLPTLIAAGFDVPFLLWQSHFEPERMQQGRYRPGVRTRVLGGDANWLLGVLRGDPLPPGQKRPRRMAAALAFLWHFGPWTHDDVFCLRDPKPLWVDVRMMIRRRAQALAGPSGPKAPDAADRRAPGPKASGSREGDRAAGDGRFSVRGLKRAVYHVSRRFGAFHVARRLTRSGLRILCYHALSFSDEHRFRPKAFIRPEVFRGRLAYLRAAGYPVISLDEAMARLATDTLPASATVITFDDGAYSIFRLAAPVLQEFRFPATVYVTTYCCVKRNPVFQVAVPYLFWKTTREEVNLAHFPSPIEGRYPLRTADERERAVQCLLEYGEKHCHETGRHDLAQRLGERLGVDYADIERSRSLSLMTSEELSQLVGMGIDVQLHTHRHRLPLNEREARREVGECRSVLAPIVGKPLKHFCYPNGLWSSRHWPWLADEGVETAMTCNPGLNYASTPRLALRRFLDGETISQVEFEAEMTGYAEVLRRIMGRRERSD
jgi:predicted ATP-grasp superfamily ATP-dependent carboligase/peptidoglycan/xylan/chitin deacetylase (PgdA/CDA1 family)